MRARNQIVVFLVALMAFQTQAWSQHRLQSGVDYSSGIQAWPNFPKVFKRPVVPEPDMANSPRLDQLIREGKLYLSLSDAIALAIENNLDIASARYGPQQADTDILRAKSGAQLRGVQTQISNLSTAASVAGGGGAARGGNVTGITGRAAGVGGGGTGAIGDATTFFGTNVPNLDPVLTGGIDYGHFSNPQTSNFVTGTNTFITESSNSNLGYRKSFLTGTSVSLNFANRLSRTNSRRANFDPSLRSNLTLQVRQRLLQGFGLAVNSRNIRIAKNNREVSDLAFEQQVVETVSRVQNLYWDLVSFRADVRGRREDVALAKRLYEDNKRRVEIGTLAPIEIVRAEAEVAARQQDLELAVTRVQMQETVLKNAISKNGLASPSLFLVEIVPTDSIQVPETEQIRPIQDLMSLALHSRPELTQSRIQLHNRDISLKGIRNAMLPQVDLVADLTNNGLSGQINENFQGFPGQDTRVSGFFLGGLGTSALQLFRRNFPDYSIGVQVTIPLKNRRAQADMTATLLERRQAQIRLRQQENAIRTEVKNAVIGVQQARAIYTAAQKTRVLQDQTLHAEQRKFDLGVSTIFLVVQAQRDLALARSTEITAQNNYIKARVEMERATGQTLTSNNISIDEAYQGTISKPADPIPPNPERSLGIDEGDGDVAAGPGQAALHSGTAESGLDQAAHQTPFADTALSEQDYRVNKLLLARAAAALNLGVNSAVKPDVARAGDLSETGVTFESATGASGVPAVTPATTSSEAPAPAGPAPTPSEPGNAPPTAIDQEAPESAAHSLKHEAVSESPPAAASAPNRSTEAAGKLTRLEVSNDGNSLHILVGSIQPAKYKLFQLNHPNRIVLDIPNIVVAVPADRRNQTVSHPAVKRIRIAQNQSHPPLARLVLEVSSFPDVEISSGSEGLEILVSASVQRSSGSLANAERVSGESSDPPAEKTPQGGTKLERLAAN